MNLDIDKQCGCYGGTHHHACKCREEYFARLEKKLEKAKETFWEIKRASETASLHWHLSAKALRELEEE